MSTIKDLEEYFLNKIETIKQQALMLDYIKGPIEIQTIVKLQLDVFQVQNLIIKLKDIINKQEQRIQELKDLNKEIKELNETIDKELESREEENKSLQLNSGEYNNVTLPSLINSDNNLQTPINQVKLLPFKNGYLTPECNSFDEDEDDLIKPSFEEIKKNSHYFFEMKYITPKEFATIPKYMKDDKTTLERLNLAIDELNKAHTKKYSILSTLKANLNEKLRSAIRDYKDQEIKATQDLSFIVEKDIQEFSKFKLDKSGLKFMTIFRHCRRIKEIRGNNLIRYAFI